jgi:hypothetical protein
MIGRNDSRQQVFIAMDSVKEANEIFCNDSSFGKKTFTGKRNAGGTDGDCGLFVRVLQHWIGAGTRVLMKINLLEWIIR